MVIANFWPRLTVMRTMIYGAFGEVTIVSMTVGNKFVDTLLILKTSYTQLHSWTHLATNITLLWSQILWYTIYILHSITPEAFLINNW